MSVDSFLLGRTGKIFHPSWYQRCANIPKVQIQRIDGNMCKYQITQFDEFLSNGIRILHWCMRCGGLYSMASGVV